MKAPSRDWLPRRDLEARLCYAVIVAGKNARFADNVTARLWMSLLPGESPFDMFRRLGSEVELRGLLRSCSSGNYKKTAKCFWQLATADPAINLEISEPSELEAFHGIGPKTSRFFILWTRPDAMYAALDVHILRWLKQQGYDAPPSTPPAGKVYSKLEAAFITEATKRGMTPRDLDWQIWSTSTKDRGQVQVESTQRDASYAA